MHQLGLRFSPEPFGQPAKFFLLTALFPLKHGKRERAEQVGVGVNGETRNPSEQTGRVQNSVEEARRVAKQREPLLQIDVQAAVEYPVETDIVLVGANGGVEGD